MANLKCKYCGGEIEQFPGNALGTCASCGSTMTLPATEDPKRIAAHNFGNYHRRIGSFDKALLAYQKLLQADPNDAEASWCSALCRYGILYELDAESGQYMPISQKTETESFRRDGDYLAALAHSSGAVRLQYEKEAARIAALHLVQPNVPDSSALLKEAFGHLMNGSWMDASECCDRVLELDSESAMAYLGKLMAEQHCRRPKDLTECEQSFENSKFYQQALLYADPDLESTLKSCVGKIKQRQQQEQLGEQYRRACAVMANASSADQYKQAAALFHKLKGYRDADKKVRECLKHAEVAQKDSFYLAAVETVSNARTAADYQKALVLFAKVPGWRDTDARAADCRQKLNQLQSKTQARIKSGNWKSTLLIMFAVLVFLSASGYLLVTRYIIPEGKYKAADAMLAANEKEAAIAAFQALGTYKDSAERASTIQTDWYVEAESYLALADFPRAAAAFGGLGDFADAKERSYNIWNSVAVRPTLCAGGWYTIGLSNTGSLLAVGSNQDKQLNVDSWQDIIAVSAGWAHTAGLKPDGTVVIAGYNGDGRGNVEDWQDIVSLSLGQWHTVGLKSNGRVVAAGCSNDGRTDLDSWRDIVAVSAGRNHTIGLRADRTLIAAGANEDGQCNVSHWVNVSSVAAGGAHTVALLLDGSVVAAGSNDEGQCQVGDWENIVAVAAGYYHTVGLKADGTVVAVGLDLEGQCEVSKWKDIVAIAAGGWHTVGLKKDGTIVSTGRNIHNQCNTADWKNIMLPKM